MSLNLIHENISKCTLCELSSTRIQTVPGEGNLNAKVFFVGEAPGKKEDESGRPFCGSSGKLLTELIESVGWRREDVFITSILKCRPPKNRLPKKTEAKLCIENHLIKQFDEIKPQIIVLMGLSAIKHVFDKIDIKEMHGNVMEKDGRKYFLTYHLKIFLVFPQTYFLVLLEILYTMNINLLEIRLVHSPMNI